MFRFDKIFGKFLLFNSISIKKVTGYPKFLRGIEFQKIWDSEWFHSFSIFVFRSPSTTVGQLSWPTVVEGDLKTPFLKATTLRCRE